MISFRDGFANILTGLGLTAGKGRGATYGVPTLQFQEAMNAYRTSGLAKRIVDLVAVDACREWREWQAQAEQIEAIEAEETRHGMREKLQDAITRARLSGGGAILIGADRANPSEPLDPRRIKKGGLEYITVLDRHDLGGAEWSTDIREPGYGSPRMWTAYGERIHPSRLCILKGAPIPQVGGQREEWGDSVLTATLDAVKRVDGTAGNVMELVYESQIDVVSIPGLSERLERDGQPYEELVKNRVRLAKQGKAITGMLILDKEEEHEQKSASFGSLDAIMDRMAQLASAHSGIPMTLLFGISPGGLNATGEHDTRMFYDRVRTTQTTVIQPAMRVLDEVLIRSALGDRPPEVHYTWRPLWSPTAGERAEIGKTISDMFSTTAMQAVPEEAIVRGLVNALTEAGAAPGFEAAVEEFYQATEAGSNDDVL